MSEDFIPYGDDMSPWSENWTRKYSALGRCQIHGKRIDRYTPILEILAALGYALEQQQLRRRTETGPPREPGQ